jgi:hypothetical protein
VFYREFTQTIDQVVSFFWRENVTDNIGRQYDEGKANLTRDHCGSRHRAER